MDFHFKVIFYSWISEVTFFFKEKKISVMQIIIIELIHVASISILISQRRAWFYIYLS